MKKICILLFCAVCGVANYTFMQAQEIVNEEQDLFPWEKTSTEYNKNFPQYSNNIGFTASYFSGVGFHYKRNITQEHSVKAVFLGWRSSEVNKTGTYVSEKSTDMFISFGLEYHYRFFAQKNFDLYALAGARTWYSEENNPSSYYKSSEIYSDNSIGLGIGIESRLGKHFVVNADIGYAHIWELERKWETDYNTPVKVLHRKDISKFRFSAGVGIGFVF